MNWLAHLYLSEADTDYQLGNLMADILRPEDRTGYGAAFNRGVACHFMIDRFSDTHPAVKWSRARLFPIYRHYSRVIVDVYYDHYLALDWHHYCDRPYQAFVREFYTAVKKSPLTFPAYAGKRLNGLIEDDWIGGYDEIDGITRAMERMALRTRKSGGAEIAKTVNELRLHHDAFHQDFNELFPELNRVVDAWNRNAHSKGAETMSN